MGRLGLERDALAAAWRAKRLWLLHVVGNPVLLALAYLWLWIPDARLWQLAGIVLGVVLAAALLWLHGGVWVFFAQTHEGWPALVSSAYRGPLRRAPALIVWAVLFRTVLWLVAWGAERIPRAADWLASVLALVPGSPISPEAATKFLLAVESVATYVVLPLLFLPLGVELAVNGFGGFRGRSLPTVWRVFRRGRYWIDYLVLFALGIYAPVRLIDWIPRVETLSGQAISLGLRFLGAYLLFLTAWLLLASLLGRLRRDAAA